MFHFRTGAAFKGWLWLYFLWRLLGKQELPPQKTHQEKEDSFFISPSTVMLLFRVFHSSVVSTEWFLQGILHPWALAASACSEVRNPNLPQTQRSSRARSCSCCVWMSHMVTDFWVPEKQQILLFILEMMWTFQSASNRRCCGARRDVWNLN